jgi:hypothetical protein
LRYRQTVSLVHGLSMSYIFVWHLEKKKLFNRLGFQICPWFSSYTEKEHYCVSNYCSFVAIYRTGGWLPYDGKWRHCSKIPLSDNQYLCGNWIQNSVNWVHNSGNWIHNSGNWQPVYNYRYINLGIGIWYKSKFWYAV